MTDSVMQHRKECLVCGSSNVELHHVLFGNPRRKFADEDGLWVWLCPEHHRGTHGVHGNDGHELDISLKKTAQEIYERNHTREEWIARYRKSYLGEDDG